MTPCREVLRCPACQLNQFRPGDDVCRRCERPLFLKTLASQESAAPCRRSNTVTIQQIGKRIEGLRRLRGWSQINLAARSGISRSYLCRIEMCDQTPGLATIEKLAETFRIGLYHFFLEESDNEALFEDPFIQGLLPFIRRLKSEQWQSILERLAGIQGIDLPAGRVLLDAKFIRLDAGIESQTTRGDSGKKSVMAVSAS